MKKFFRAYELKAEYMRLGVALRDIQLRKTHFDFIECNTAAECLETIKTYGIPGTEYTILEVYQKEVSDGLPQKTDRIDE